jgi:hypothetical protein
MNKIEAIAYLRKKQLLEKQAIREEIFNTREEAEEAMRELEETEKKDLTTDQTNV